MNIQNATMKNVSSKRGWMTGMTQPHVESLSIPLTKEKHDGKSDKYFVKLKLHRYPTLYTMDFYEFKMSLFDNVEPEKFCCLYVTSTRPSRRQGRWRRMQSFKTFVLFSAGKCCVSLTRFLLTQKVQKP